MSKEYGTALFSLALEGGNEQAFAEALDEVIKMFDENPAYVDFLSAPNIPQSERLSAIKEAFSDAVPAQIVSFLQLLCQNNRMHLLHDCAKEYKHLYAASVQVSEAYITSAAMLSQAEKDALAKALQKKCGHAVSPHFEVDENLLGGVVVEVDGNVLDGSLRHRLREIKDVMQNE